jgi:hypothetical protein
MVRMARKSLLFLILIIVSAAVPGQVEAQATPDTQVLLTADRYELTVGDVVSLRLEARYPRGYQVFFPDLPPQWGDFEVRSQRTSQIRDNGDGTETTTRIIEAALFSTGTFETPELVVTVRDTAGQTTGKPVQPLTLAVTPVLRAGEVELRDIKPTVGLSVVAFWPWLILGVAVIGAVILGMALLALKLIESRRSGRIVKADLRTPYEVAMDELNRIEQVALPEQGRIDEHYVLVEDCIRRYLQEAYQIPAFDQTTEEIWEACKAAAITPEDAEQLTQLLYEADLVKFTDLDPDAVTTREFTRRARSVLELITPVATWSGRKARRSSRR